MRYLVILVALFMGCQHSVEWPEEQETEVSAPVPIPDRDFELLKRLAEQRFKKPMIRFSKQEGVIDGNGEAVPNSQLTDESECIHNMPLNWTCTLCPSNQRLLKEQCFD